MFITHVSDLDAIIYALNQLELKEEKPTCVILSQERYDDFVFRTGIENASSIKGYEIRVSNELKFGEFAIGYEIH